jgi:hypothetical protein
MFVSLSVMLLVLAYAVLPVCFVRAVVVDLRQASAPVSDSSKIPDYFDTTIGWFAGKFVDSSQVRRSYS